MRNSYGKPQDRCQYGDCAKPVNEVFLRKDGTLYGFCSAEHRWLYARQWAPLNAHDRAIFSKLYVGGDIKSMDEVLKEGGRT